MDGVGPQILAITPTAYIHYKAVEKLDFSNPRDIQYLINRHPHMAVRKAPQTVKTQVGYRPPSHPSPIPAPALLATEARQVRETTKYAHN